MNSRGGINSFLKVVDKERTNKVEIMGQLRQAPPREDPAYYHRNFRIDEGGDYEPDPKLEPPPDVNTDVGAKTLKAD